MYSVGIDLGGTNIATGLVDEQGQIVAKLSVPTRVPEGPQVIAKDMAETVKLVCEKAGVPLSEVDSVGIGSPGAINSREGIVMAAYNLRFSQVPLSQEVGQHLNLPVCLSNDANCAALGEAVSGAAAGLSYVVMLTLGTGVGGGVIIDGRIYEGFNGTAAELGHEVIVSGGEPCTCGRRGCLESYASASALIRMTKTAMRAYQDSLMWELCEQNLDKVSGRTAFQAARAGDTPAIRVVDDYIGYLAEGVTNYINIFQPECVIIGGGVAGEGEYLLEPLRKLVYERCFGYGSFPVAEIKKAILGNDAGVIGAAMLYRRQKQE